MLTVDDGAKRALIDKGKSLLPVGVVRIEGDFAKGDLVAVHDESGIEIARGLTNYSRQDADKVREAPKSRRGNYEEMIHRDNMTIVD